jgi:hypothetical protein
MALGESIYNLSGLRTTHDPPPPRHNRPAHSPPPEDISAEGIPGKPAYQVNGDETSVTVGSGEYRFSITNYEL